MSHEISTIVAKHINLLDEACVANDPLTVTRGKTHENLGMTIDFSLKRGVAMMQRDFSKKLWVTLPPDLKGNYRSTPAQDSLFKADKDVPLLNHARKDAHHGNAAKMLWTS